MTQVKIAVSVPTADGAGRRPNGQLEWKPSKRRNVSGDVVLPSPFKADITDPPTVVTVAPTEPGWAWEVVERVSGGATRRRFVTVPDSASVINYADLVEVDPATLDPVTLTNAWWTEVTNYVAGALPTTLPPSGGAGGALSGSYPNPGLNETTVDTVVAGKVNDGTSATSVALRAAYGALQKVAATVTTAGALVVGKHNPVDATGGARTMTLPTGQPEGTQVSVEKVDSSANVVTISGSIRGVGSSTISVPWKNEALLLRADSAGSWWPISGHKTKTSMDSANDVRYLPRNRATKRLSWWYAALVGRETATATVWVCGDSNGEGSGSPTRWLDVAADALMTRYPTSGFTQRPRYYPCRYENSGNPSPWVYSDSTPLVFDTTGSYGFGGRSVVQPKFNASSATVTATLTVTGQLRANVLYPTGVGSGNIEVRVNGASTPTLTITPAATPGQGRSSTLTLTGGTDTIELRAASSATPIQWNGVLTWDGTDHGISVIDASHAGFSAVDYNNAQVVNRTTLKYLANTHSTMRPDLVLIPLSYNDYNQKLAPSATAAALQSMIASIRSAFANVSFLLIAHTDSGAVVGPAAPWSDYVAALRTVADSDTGGIGGTSGVDFMDLGDLFVAPAIDNSLGAYGADKVHFTTTIGHPIVGQAVAGRLSL